MKKLFLTLAILSVLVCALVISVGAATTNEFGEVEIISGMDEKSVFGADGTADGYTSRVVLFDGTEYHTYPAYYVFTNNVNTTTDFKQLNEKAGKSYGKTNVIRAEVPHNVQKVTGDIFNCYNDLKYVRFPDTLTVISGNMFYTSHGLEWVNVPRDCTLIQAYAFYGCASLQTIDMSNAQSLKRTESNQFYNCPSLKELIFPEGFEYFGGAGGGGSNQTGLKSLETLYLPDSVTYMGGISEAKSLKTVKIPLGVTSLSSNQINWSPGVKQVIIHKGVTSIDQNAFNMTLYVKEFIYTGEATDSVVSVLSKYSGNVANTVSFGNHCQYYYDGVHLEDNNPCVVNCTRCNSVGVPEVNPQHSEIISIVYASYEANGEKLVSCQNEGCTYCVSTETDPLFVRRGYSAPEYDISGLSIAYVINGDAIAEYESVNGVTLEYGVFAVLQKRLGENDIFDENKNAASGVIAAELSSYGFVTMNLKIVGFEGEQKDAKLAMGAFVCEATENTVTYAYLQEKSPLEGEKYYFTSYNEITSSGEGNEEK